MIVLDGVHVGFPLPTSAGRSFRSSLLNIAIPSRIRLDSQRPPFVEALIGIDLKVERGERLGVLGSNGAGKSTLLRLISGVYRPDRGQMRVKGRLGSLIDITLGMNPEASGRQNIFLRAGLMGYSRKQASEKLEEIIEFAGLGQFIDLPVRTYSTGMHMRLAFSVSTAFSPEILIMDEWLSVGDFGFQTRAEEKLVQVIDESEVLIIASHDRSLLEKLCTRAIVLSKGQKIFDGEVFEATRIFFGESRPSPG